MCSVWISPEGEQLPYAVPYGLIPFSQVLFDFSFEAADEGMGREKLKYFTNQKAAQSGLIDKCLLSRG